MPPRATGSPRSGDRPRARRTARRALRPAAVPGPRRGRDRAGPLDRARRARDQAAWSELFAERISPVLTPLAVDPAHPFPYISGLSLNLAVVVRDAETGDEHFARVKVPPLLPRYLPTDETRTRFVPVEEVIAAHLPDLFPGMEVVEASTFRVTRNEDLEVDDDVDNLLQALERELSRRRFGTPVRLEVEDDTSERVLALLVRELEISDQEVYRLPAPLDLAALWAIADLERADLRYPAMVPETPAPLRPSEGGAGHLRRDARAATCWSTTPTTRSPRACRRSSSRPRPTRTPMPSSSRCTAPAVSRRSSTRWSTRPWPASRCWSWSRSRHASTSRPTSAGPASSSRPGATSSTGWSASRRTASSHWWCGRRRTAALRRYVHVGTGNYNPKTARRLRGPRPAHRRPRGRRGRGRPVQPPVRLHHGTATTTRCSSPRTRCAAA